MTLCVYVCVCRFLSVFAVHHLSSILLDHYWSVFAATPLVSYSEQGDWQPVPLICDQRRISNSHCSMQSLSASSLSVCLSVCLGLLVPRNCVAGGEGGVRCPHPTPSPPPLWRLSCSRRSRLAGELIANIILLATDGH